METNESFLFVLVVADLMDETSIRMAPVWKQLALNSATTTGQEDRLPGTLQIPVLLMGNKLDEVSTVVHFTLVRGVDKFFKTLAKLASSSEFLLTRSENNWPKI
jgi:hypothetical protein